jgi:hypothetical protein
MIRVVFLVSLAACGSESARHILDSCVASGSNAMTLTGQASYVCHDPFKAQVTFTNNSCDPIVVTGVKLSAITTTGACVPPGDYTYPQGPNVGGTVAPGATMNVLNLTGGQFCCIAPGPCPDPFECDETYTMTVESAAGDLISKTESVHLSLGGCDQVCP